MKNLRLLLISTFLGFLIIHQCFGLIILLNYMSLRKFPISRAISFWFPRHQIFDIFGYPIPDRLFFLIVILCILILLELFVLLILIIDSTLFKITDIIKIVNLDEFFLKLYLAILILVLLTYNFFEILQISKKFIFFPHFFFWVTYVNALLELAGFNLIFCLFLALSEVLMFLDPLKARFFRLNLKAIMRKKWLFLANPERIMKYVFDFHVYSGPFFIFFPFFDFFLILVLIILYLLILKILMEISINIFKINNLDFLTYHFYFLMLFTIFLRTFVFPLFY